jgi:hypothetical protein
MSGAPPAPALSPLPDPQDRPGAGAEAPSRNGHFLGLLRKLIDYGKGLACTLQRRTATTNLFQFKLRFGTIDVAAIIASITRALLLAAALEARLISHPILSDTTPREGAPSPRKPRAVPPPAEDVEACLYRLPTPAQVAAAVRRRPAGAVLVDICCELGLDCRHPLWKELEWAIRLNGGDPSKLIIRLLRLDSAAVIAEADGDLLELLNLPLVWTDWREAPAASGAGPPLEAVRTTVAA